MSAFQYEQLVEEEEAWEEEEEEEEEGGEGQGGGGEGGGGVLEIYFQELPSSVSPSLNTPPGTLR